MNTISPLQSALDSAPLLDLFTVGPARLTISGVLPSGATILHLIEADVRARWALTDRGLVRLGGNLRALVGSAHLAAYARRLCRPDRPHR